MRSLYEILAQRSRRAQRYVRRPVPYVRRMASLVRKALPDARVVLFGSAARGDSAPGSDIDVLVISALIPEGLFEQARIKLQLSELFPEAPFEIHLVTPEEYQGWYAGFIGPEAMEL
ncbi:MAG: nucleotidyltransferase domain-containing protein [candidate division KSB1 bacterium]|nr:nucleotidyltransferase domain-containing protein [candidate division KSB1 bacterium]